MSQKTSSSSGNTMLVVAVLGVLAVALGIAVLGGDPPSDFDLEAVEAPEIVGDPVAAAGDPAPLVTADSLFDDTRIDLLDEGEPTMLVFLAHWCPACNAEVPVVVDWIEAGNLPDDVTVRAVATAIDPARPNFPPDTWLTERDWPTEAVIDPDGSIQAAYGVTGYPAWVFVDADGTVQGNAGPLEAEQLDQVVELLAP